MELDQKDHSNLRRAFAVALQAKAHGNLPFASVLADAAGNILLEAENQVISDKDPLGHAEVVMIRQMLGQFTPEQLATCTVYTSAEPCPMCAAAIYWAGIRRLVYGLSTEKKNTFTAHKADIPSLQLDCRTVLNSGNHAMEVHGPLLEEEALQVHLAS